MIKHLPCLTVRDDIVLHMAESIRLSSSGITDTFLGKGKIMFSQNK